jgi:hypothetical protein
MNGYVYLILEIDKDGHERHKLGITKNNPEKRVKQLSTGNSDVIRLLQTYESPNYKKVEQWLHSRFSCNKTAANNEWFHLTDEQVLGFQDICKKVDETINLLLKENHFFK